MCLPDDAFGQPPPLPVTRLDERPRVADLDAPHAVSLTIAQPIAITDAILLLTRGTAFSIVLDDTVDGATFSGELKDLSLRQALDAVLRPRGLEYSVDGNLVTVHRPRPEMRLFDVSYLGVRRDVPKSVGVSYYDEIESGVASLLSATGRAHVDRRSGVVQVTDFRECLQRVATYLETVHVRALRQVRLQARILEITLSDPNAQSVDWNSIAMRSGQPWTLTEQSVGLRVNDYAALMAALSAQGTVRTLAAPQLLAMNSEPAIMRVGSEDVSLATMTITPYIDAGGMVHLSVTPSYTEKIGAAVNIAEVDTVLRLRDGESVLLAGLLQRKDTVRTELVILLNATIVTPGPARSGAR